MLREPELTFLKNVSEKVFSDKSSLLETQALADNKSHTELWFTKATFMVFCTALILYRGFDCCAYNAQVLFCEQQCNTVCITNCVV